MSKCIVAGCLPKQFLASHIWDGPQSESTKHCTNSLGARKDNGKNEMKVLYIYKCLLLVASKQ